MSNKVKMMLTVAYEKCNSCGYRRKLYFMSNYSYGERIITANSGEKCAYVNLLEENITNELVVLCESIFNDRSITVSSVKMGEIISDIYPITCDLIDGENVDDIVRNKCSNCKEGIMVEDTSFVEKIELIEMPLVTHKVWNNRNYLQKKHLIYDFLEILNYI